MAARVPDLDIFSEGLVERQSGGWRITEKGRVVLEFMEARSRDPEPAAKEAAAEPPPSAPAKATAPRAKGAAPARTPPAATRRSRKGSDRGSISLTPVSCGRPFAESGCGWRETKPDTGAFKRDRRPTSPIRRERPCLWQLALRGPRGATERIIETGFEVRRTVANSRSKLALIVGAES